MPTRNGGSSNRPDLPFKDIYTSSRANGGVTSATNLNDANRFRLRTKAMQNVSFLNNKVSSSRHRSTSALRKRVDGATPRSVSRSRSKLPAPSALNKPKSAESRIKTLQKELDEVQFFREIEETQMESQEKQRMSRKSLSTHPQQHLSEPQMKERLYEYELQVKKMDLELKSSNDVNAKLIKKLKSYKDSQENQEKLEEKIKALEKETRSAKKSNTSMEKKILNLEQTIEFQQEQLQEQSKLDEKFKEKDNEIVALQKELQKQKKHNKSLDKQINDCIETIEVAEEQLHESRTQATELRTANENLEAQLKLHNEDLEEKIQHSEEQSDELNSLKTKLDEINDELLSLSKQLENKEVECAIKEDELLALAEELETCKEKFDEEFESMEKTLAEVELKNTDLLSVLVEKESELKSCRNELKEIKGVFDATSEELDEKNKLLHGKKNLEERFNSTKEILDSNKVILEMQTKEMENLKQKLLEKGTKLEQEVQENGDLRTQIAELSVQVSTFRQSLVEKDDEKSDYQKEIEVLSRKLAQMEDQLDKSNKSKEEVLTFSRTKFKKTEAELRQSISTKQNDISQLQKKLLKEQVEKETIQKKFEKQTAEIQKKLDEATQKLIDTMSTSLASGRELEEYRSKVSNSEAQNEETVKNLKNSLESINEELAKNKQTAEQYKQVAEKLCLEIEDIKYRHDLEVDELEKVIVDFNTKLESKTSSEITLLNEEHEIKMRELQSRIDYLKVSIEKERSHNAELNRGNDSIDNVLRLFQSKFSRILSTYAKTPYEDTGGDQSVTKRVAVLSDSLFDIVRTLEQDLSVLKSKAETMEEDLKQSKQAHQREISSFQNNIKKYSADRVKESEWQKTLQEQRDQLKKTLTELADVKTASEKHKEKYNMSKARSDAHITALHAALDDAKADIAHLEAIVRVTGNGRAMSISDKSDFTSISRKFQSDNSSITTERTSSQATRDYFLNDDRNSISSSPFRKKNMTHGNPRDNSQVNNYSLQNLGSSDMSCPDDEWNENNNDSDDVHTIELNALREFISLRSEKNNEI